MNTMVPPGLLLVRRRCARPAKKRNEQPVLTVRMLGGYTIDPPVPHLGVRLYDVGLPADFTLGPYSQNLQEHPDDSAGTGRLRPDVLAVTPRFEELAAHGDVGDLTTAADAAMGAAARWRSCLVVVSEAVEQLWRRGVRLANRRGSAAESWPRLAAVSPGLWGDPRVLSAPDGHSPSDELASCAAEVGVLVGSVAPLDAAPGPAERSGGPTVLFGEEPADWPAEPAESGLLDGLPDPRGAGETLPGASGQAPRAARPEAPAASLAEFIAGLGGAVEFRDVARGLDEQTGELTFRTLDFTLGGAPRRLSRRVPASPRRRASQTGWVATTRARSPRPSAPAGSVRSRSSRSPSARSVAALRMRSCARSSRADRDGCHNGAIGYRETGRSQIAVEFPRGADERTWAAPSGREELRMLITWTERTT
ncbi:hypothetical protein [Streptomyces tanashiensis]|uniref:hypothetical protein n=1 Tax=Streptomyces tanashiensis TaxID=67367 RepID=UPI0033D7DACA